MSWLSLLVIVTQIKLNIKPCAELQCLPPSPPQVKRDFSTRLEVLCQMSRPWQSFSGQNPQGINTDAHRYISTSLTQWLTWRREGAKIDELVVGIISHKMLDMGRSKQVNCCHPLNNAMETRMVTPMTVIGSMDVHGHALAPQMS